MSTRPSPRAMAEVLAEQVPEIKDRRACRIALAFAGYDDIQIGAHLTTAQRLARTLRGQMADDLVLSSQRVTPARLQSSGYTFRYPTLEGALRSSLGR